MPEDISGRGGNGRNGDGTWPLTDGRGCPACGAVWPGGHGGYCPNAGRNYDADGNDAAVAHYRRVFGIQQQARDLGRGIMTAGQGWRGSLYGAVTASYPEGSRVARHDSWRCHHEHPDDLSALECALGEVRRLAGGGSYEPCSTGPDCTDEFCRRDWARPGVAGRKG